MSHQPTLIRLSRAMKEYERIRGLIEAQGIDLSLETADDDYISARTPTGVWELALLITPVAHATGYQLDVSLWHQDDVVLCIGASDTDLLEERRQLHCMRPPGNLPKTWDEVLPVRTDMRPAPDDIDPYGFVSTCAARVVDDLVRGMTDLYASFQRPLR